jgi:nitroreductase
MAPTHGLAASLPQFQLSKYGIVLPCVKLGLTASQGGTEVSAITSEAIKRIFTDARTHNAWLPRPVSDQELREIYELMKWGPTSANLGPARVVYVKSAPQKAKLLSAVAESNAEKVKAAPVTAIIAMDERFYDQAAKLFPHSPGIKGYFASDAGLAATTAMRNSSLQGAYFIIAARALGLDCGPMSGFDNKKLDELFFAGSSWKSNFICNIGHGDAAKLFPRLPRLSFEEACRIE